MNLQPQIVYPLRTPRVGCAVLVQSGECLLLGERGKEPFRGKWIIPGGGVRFLENFEEAASRELYEEAGIEIEATTVVDVQEIVSPPNEHRVRRLLHCHLQGWRVTGSDLSAARFFTKDEVRDLVARRAVTPTVERVLRKMAWA